MSTPVPASHAAATTRLLIDPAPETGAWNMAVDELLLESAISSPRCAVRVYQWAEATISLGYFQDAGVPCNDPKLQQLPVVRRLSGGGALLHQHELTYACIVPAGHVLTRALPKIYTTVHQSIAAVLVRYGFPVRMRGKTDASRSSEFFCFGRGDEHDLVLEGCKVLGSAQRRRKGAVLQHGSLLLQRSEFVPQYAGILDLAARPVELSGLAAELASEIGRVFGNPLRAESLIAEEITEAQALRVARYATLDRQLATAN